MSGLSRRAFLRAGSAGAAACALPWLFRSEPAGADPRDEPLLVVVFLRGGADGLALVPRVDDPDLRRARRGLIAADGPRLDAGFALHPALAPLHPLYGGGELAVVQAVGLAAPLRSHFEAQDVCERGGARAGTRVQGWLARSLATGTSDGRLPAVALARGRPLALDGDPDALAFASLRELRSPAGSAEAEAALERLFAASAPASATRRVAEAGRRALDVAAQVRAHAGADAPSRRRGRQAVGSQLATLARLARADLGLRAAWVDVGGWDTHVRQGAAEGTLARHAAGLAEGLATLLEQLGPRRASTLVLVFSEFGRTVAQNGSGGTDHGRAGVALALGGAVRGGRVLGRWPGLAPAALEDGRDLRVTTDIRDVLAEGSRHLGCRDLGPILPGYAPDPLGLLRDGPPRYPLPGSSIPL